MKLTISNVDDRTIQKLEQKASRDGLSFDDPVRCLLHDTWQAQTETGYLSPRELEGSICTRKEPIETD